MHFSVDTQKKMTDDEKISLLEFKPVLLELFREIEEELIDRMKVGEEFEGWDIERKKSKRTFIDDKDAILNMLSKYLTPDQILTKKPTTISDLKSKLIAAVITESLGVMKRKEASIKADEILSVVLETKASDGYNLLQTKINI